MRICGEELLPHFMDVLVTRFVTERCTKPYARLLL